MSSHQEDRVFSPVCLGHYTKAFPVLAGKALCGQGCYSAVFDNGDSVLKLTCDHVYRDFICSCSGSPGVPKLIKDHGFIEDEEFGIVHLLEIEKLTPLDKWDHESLVLESKAIAQAIEYRVAARELGESPEYGNKALVNAVKDVIGSQMFSRPIMWALSSICKFIEKSGHDVLFDLKNPANFMTNGKHLIISDPLIPVD